MTENGSPKLMQNVAKINAKCSQERLNRKTSANCTLKTIQNVVNND